jgi:hypothetical protein
MIEKKEAVIIPKEEKGSDLAILLSRVDHPIELGYDGKGLMIYPRGRTTPLEKKKLGAVPKGVQIINFEGRG